MSKENAIGSEFSAPPYLLDDAAAQSYERGVKEPPRRWRTNIHTDRDAASKAGFTAPIAAGEHTIALAMQLVVDRFGDRFMRGGAFDVALIKPVLFGDTLTAHARVTGADEHHLELDLRVENQDGVKVLTGTARVPQR